MALTVKYAAAHIARWSKTLQAQSPFRGNWPSRLFHHAPLDNALGILKTRRLFSRADTSNPMRRDVAAEGVIDNSETAHRFARLYFRPRTPTQFHIEGIRKDSECKYGAGAHAPVLVFFVFRALPILTSKGTRFSDRNMQLGSAQLGDDDDFFEAIPFDKVYHEGNTWGDRSIIDHRCAEVLAESGLSLSEHLQWVYCRSPAERATLVHLLGNALASVWMKKIIVSDDLKLFERKYCFVENVSLSNEGVRYQLNPRVDGQRVTFRIRVWPSPGDVPLLDFKDENFLPVPAGGGSWITKVKLKDGLYKVRIDIEGKLAYKDIVLLGNDLF